MSLPADLQALERNVINKHSRNSPGWQTDLDDYLSVRDKRGFGDPSYTNSQLQVILVEEGNRVLKERESSSARGYSQSEKISIDAYGKGYNDGQMAY